MAERWELPDEEDVENSGMGDWLDRAMADQDRRNQKLAGLLGDTREALVQRKKDLGDLLSAPVEGTAEEEEPAPDLFEQERAEQLRSRQGMASFVDEERRRKEEERRSLGGLFGPPSPPRRKR